MDVQTTLEGDNAIGELGEAIVTLIVLEFELTVHALPARTR